MTLRAAEEHYTRQARLAALVSRRSLALWRQVPAGDVNTWRAILPQAASLVTAAQFQAATAAEPYTAAALAEQGAVIAPQAVIAPRAFIGAAGDGRSLLSLLDEPRITTLTAIRDGYRVGDALALGATQLQTLAVTQVQDVGRLADSVAIITRPRVGWVRMVNPPCCSRCAILAGKVFRSNQGFQRHPRCDCRHIPTLEDAPGDLGTDPESLFRSGQVTGLSRAEASAVADGADPGQVINARRRSSGMTTSEGTTSRGRAGRPGGGARLTPDGIYRIAPDRDEALRLLQRHGYVA